MKKTIKILVEKMEKLEDRKDGKLQGGFISVRGGFNAKFFSTNENGCTNSHDCTHSTNTGHPVCTNTGTCLI